MENESHNTLSFKSKKVACRNESEIKNYFSDRIVNSEIVMGKDERGNYGYQVKYILTNQ